MIFLKTALNMRPSCSARQSSGWSIGMLLIQDPELLMLDDTGGAMRAASASRPTSFFKRSQGPRG